MALLKDGLLPASFRGVPFAVRTSSAAYGRRLALHQYPGRDDPWAEDLGRSARRWRFSGFLVTGDAVYAGGPVALQRTLLIAVLEAKGSGTLTHPTLGLLTVAVESAQVTDPLEAGSYCELELTFVEAGKQKFPQALVSSGSKLLSAANLAKIAVAADFVRAIALVAKTASSQDRLATTGHQWGGQVRALAADATAVVGLTSRLVGPFGRFSAGANRGYTSGYANPYAKDVTVADLIRDASAQRSAVDDAAQALDDTIAAVTVTTGIDDVATAAQALVDALVAACANPADAIRLLATLLDFAYPGGEQTAIDVALGNLFRRSAVAAMALVAGSFQPASYDQAVEIRTAVVALIDGQIDRAGDTGEDETFNALRSVRVLVVRDFNERGADLAPTQAFTLPGPLPALALAARLYRDPSRADQLVTETVPIHPLFMPHAFRALAA